MGARARGLVLGGLLLLAAAACGGEGGQGFALYHLELAIGPPGANGELHCGPPRPVCPGVITQPPPGEVHYELRAAPAVGEDGIDRAGVRAHGSTVAIPLTAAGTAAFARLTREVARYGARDQGWHHVAVVIGDEIVAFPEIDFDKYPNGLPNARSLQLSVSSVEDARELAERLGGS